MIASSPGRFHHRTIVLCIGLLTLAGCTDPSSSSGTTSTDERAPPPFTSPDGQSRYLENDTWLTGPQPANWSRLEFSMQGMANEWVAASQTWPPGKLQYRVLFNLTTTGPGPTTAFIEPLLEVLADSGDAKPHTLPFVQRGVLAQPGPIQLALDSGEITNTATAQRVVFAASADQPWTLTVVVLRPGDDGPPIGPEKVRLDAGLECVVGADRTLPLLPGVAGDLTLSTTFSKPGWTFLHIIADDVQAAAVRNVTVRFASGAEHDGIGPGIPGSPAFGYYGELLDKAGAFSARLTFAEVSLGVDLAVCHVPIPGAFFDPTSGLDTIYQGWNMPNEL